MRAEPMLWLNRQLLCLNSGTASFEGCTCWPIMSHSVQQGCPNLKTPLKAEPDGFSFIPQHIPKCIVAPLLLWNRGWSVNKWDKQSKPANDNNWTYSSARQHHLIALHSGFPDPWRTQLLQTWVDWVLWRLQPLNWGIASVWAGPRISHADAIF